jgi:hypothetical protein
VTAPAQTGIPRLGQHIVFRDHENLPKAAMVTCTTETYNSSAAQRNGGSQVPPLNSQDEVHLVAFSPTGSIESRKNIRRGHGPGQWSPADEGYR